VVEKLAQTFLEFPPMQKPASFSIERVKEELQKKLQSLSAQ
jgi:arylsulfatase